MQVSQRKRREKKTFYLSNLHRFHFWHIEIVWFSLFTLKSELNMNIHCNGFLLARCCTFVVPSKWLSHWNRLRQKLRFQSLKDMIWVFFCRERKKQTLILLSVWCKTFNECCFLSASKKNRVAFVQLCESNHVLFSKKNLLKEPHVFDVVYDLKIERTN